MDLTDIILDNPSRYLKKSEYENIISNLFCVGDLKYTRILSSYMRPLRVVKNIRKKLNISDDCNEKELKDRLVNLKVGIVRRKVVNGVKQDDNFYIDNGIISDIENINCFYLSKILIKTKYGQESIKASRVYYFL